ncbi:MAG TPA: hypothetical protein VGO86_15310 [Candidatus Dormibacteraeota bacterium]
MQPVPPSQPQQPYPAPPRAGWSRFWLGVLAGGCGLLLVELLVVGVGALLVGSAITSALRGGSGGLPGRLRLPANLPNLSTRSDSCSPQPCLAHGGITVLVGNVNRNAGAAETSGEHLVQVDVTFVGTAGTHTINPDEIAIRDSTGAMTLPGLDPAAARCGATPATQDLRAGQRAGPFSLCYAVGDAAGGAVTLIWIDPEDVSVIELPLP